MPEVIATFEDGSSKSFFTFYPSEITFRVFRFIGLTEEEAHRLFQDRDTTYLRQYAGEQKAVPKKGPDRTARDLHQQLSRSSADVIEPS